MLFFALLPTDTLDRTLLSKGLEFAFAEVLKCSPDVAQTLVYCWITDAASA